MVITINSLRADVRAKFQNLGLGTLPDDTLDVDVKTALWRLSRDRPFEANFQLTATGEKHNLNALLSDWLPEFSTIRQIWKPIPTTSMTNSDPIEVERYRVRDIGGTSWLFLDEGISNSSGVLLVYTVPRRLVGIDGAVTTTVPEVLNAAFLWITCHHVALSMAAKAAGSNDKSVPADFTNFGSTKSDQYRRVAREFELAYMDEMGLDKSRPKAVGMTKAYPSRSVSGEPYMTHRGLGAIRGRQ